MCVCVYVDDVCACVCVYKFHLHFVFLFRLNESVRTNFCKSEDTQDKPNGHTQSQGPYPNRSSHTVFSSTTPGTTFVTGEFVLSVTFPPL